MEFKKHEGRKKNEEIEECKNIILKCMKEGKHYTKMAFMCYDRAWVSIESSKQLRTFLERQIKAERENITKESESIQDILKDSVHYTPEEIATCKSLLEEKNIKWSYLDKLERSFKGRIKKRTKNIKLIYKEILYIHTIYII